MSSSSSPPVNPFAALSVGKSFKVKTVDLTLDDDSKHHKKHKKDKRKHSRHHYRVDRSDDSPQKRRHHQKKRRRSSSASSSSESEPAHDRSSTPPPHRSGDIMFNLGPFQFFPDTIGASFSNGQCFRPEVPTILKRLANSGGRRDGVRDAPVRYYDRKATAVVNGANTDHWDRPQGNCRMPGADDTILKMAAPEAGVEESDDGKDGDPDERDLKVPLGELETENRRLIQRCRAHPDRVANWMEFIDHQKRWMSSLGIDKGSIEDKIRVILEDAVKSSPGTPRLWQLRLLDHAPSDPRQDRALWTMAMREPSVASSLASSCVQSLIDSSTQTEEATRDPAALLELIMGSGVLSSLTVEVVYEILCRVAMFDMSRALLLFRGVATRALFHKVAPLIGSPSAHYALVGHDIMNVNPGFLGICESVDAATPAQTNGDDVEVRLAKALSNFPPSPILGWAAKEFSLELPQVTATELSEEDTHLVERLARGLSKRDGIELTLRLVDILCGDTMGSLERCSCRNPYRLVFHGYFGDTAQLPLVSGDRCRVLAARCLAQALLACTTDEIEESLLLRDLIIRAEPSTGRAVVATSTSSIRLWAAYALSQLDTNPSVMEKCLSSFDQCFPLKAALAHYKLLNGSLSTAVECITGSSSNVAIASKLEELREGLASADRTDPPCIGLPSTFSASIWCIWLLNTARNPTHPEKPLAEFWRLLPDPTSAVADLSNRSTELVCQWLIDCLHTLEVPPNLMRAACLKASRLFPGRPALLPVNLPIREQWRLQPIAREPTASAVLGVHLPALRRPIAAAYASSKLPTASLEVANVLQASDRSLAERHCLAGLGRLPMPHRGLWALRVALIDRNMIDYEDKVVDIVCAMAEAGMEPRSDVVEWLAAVEAQDEGSE